MKRVSIVAAAFFVAAGFAAESAAQTQGGEQELGLLAAYYKPTEGGSDGFLFGNVRYGVFVTAALQVGGGLAVGGTVDDLDESASGELFGAYYFSPEKTNTFYVRGGYFAIINDFGDGFIDLAGGYKSYFTERVAFFWEGGYGTAIGSGVDGGVVRSLTGITFTF
jgi:hypothetical protein